MSQHFNYRHLYYFWVVAKEGGMSRAAARLDMAVQTVSAQVRELERSLGVQLLRPAGRGVALTEAGQRALQQAEVIFEAGEALPGLLRAGVAAAPTVRLALGISDTLPKLVVRHLVQPVLDTPGLRLVCHEQGFDDLLGNLAVHRLDLLLADRPAPPHAGLKVFSHAMGSSQLAWYGTPELAARAKKRFPQGLADVPVLLPSAHASVRPHIDRWFSQHALTPQVCGEFEDSALLKIFGAGGMGVFPAAELVHQQLLAQYGVQRIDALEGVVEHFYGISTERRVVHPLVRRMVAAAEPT
ncbi:LysR family transcriptional regulator [Pelomonas sp. UHG3]|jgi:LysR family transcriptional activator of nhaA|uniref:LysR family transcriptional regulator n=1 Tax=Roseateles hydrophilus TaxID=2975054 RepID=A0ACC6CDE6_9BURK|nr:LysR family transcriptional regulator [Pelomonas sp. UHG3]MCY4746385.1 LysR family transcriptional regulator [Pelomonas sp. UHG3]